MIALKPLPRIFQYSSLEIPDPDPTLDVEGVKRVLANRFPELLNAGVEGPTISGDRQVFTFVKALGTKG